ncbi:hypothetical protein [Sphingomonas sp. RB1R13]|uniref:hypothetical protein n=1 Tax=Sphingomonas sp. RB1R13 TaxID=3096159 RepID=UPI002FC5CF8E
MPIVTKPTLCTITLAAAATLAATFAATPASAALNAFLKIGGTPAPTTSAARSGHKDWIEVSSWSWGTSNGRKGWDGSIKGRKGWDGTIKGRDAPPPGAGELRVKVRFPWTDCRVGATVPDATLDDAAASYAFSSVVVTRCDPDAVTLSYAKVTVRGWHPAKKEE